MGDGSEYPLVYPYESIAYLMTALADAARRAFRRRVARNPQEAAQGMDTNVIPVDEVRIGASSDKAGTILHFTTVDGIPIALELPGDRVGELAEALRGVLGQRDGATSVGRKRLH